MNSDEVVEIKKTWDIASDHPTDAGVAILVKFFTKYPSNLKSFKVFQDREMDEVKNDTRFKAHALRIVLVFDDSVQSLDNDWKGPKLEEIWTKIATTHFKRRIEKQSFNELKEVVLEVLAEICKMNETQKAAWVKLIDIIYEIIFKTMDKLEEEKDKTK